MQYKWLWIDSGITFIWIMFCFHCNGVSKAITVKQAKLYIIGTWHNKYNLQTSFQFYLIHTGVLHIFEAYLLTQITKDVVFLLVVSLHFVAVAKCVFSHMCFVTYSLFVCCVVVGCCYFNRSRWRIQRMNRWIKTLIYL